MDKQRLLYSFILCVAINLISCKSNKEAMDFKPWSSNRLIAIQELTNSTHIAGKIAGEMIVTNKLNRNLCFAEKTTETNDNENRTLVIKSILKGGNILSGRKIKPISSFQKLAFDASNIGKLSKNTTGDCDTIVFNDGSKRYGKVMKVDLKHINYQNCNEPNGPLLIYLRSNVKEIKYANGYVEIISHITSYRLMNLGGLWFTLLILSVALFSIAGMIGTFSIGGVVLFLISGLAAIAFLVYYICWLMKIMQIIKPE